MALEDYQEPFQLAQLAPDQLEAIRRRMESEYETNRQIAIGQEQAKRKRLADFQASPQGQALMQREQEARQLANPNLTQLQRQFMLEREKARLRPQPQNPIIQTDDAIYERTAQGLVPLKGPGGVPLKPKGDKPKPPKDFKWNEDMTEHVLIPGSPTDLKMRAVKEKDLKNKATLDSTVDAEIRNIDQLINVPGKKDGLHPGLRAMVGPVDVLFPTLLTDTANAEALLESLQSKASISSLNTIRGTTGSIGSLTEREWPRLESMKATLQKTQGTKQFVQSLRDYKNELERLKRIGAQSVSDTTGAVAPYAGPERRTGDEPPPGTVRRKN